MLEVWAVRSIVKGTVLVSTGAGRLSAGIDQVLVARRHGPIAVVRSCPPADGPSTGTLQWVGRQFARSQSDKCDRYLLKPRWMQFNCDLLEERAAYLQTS
jgi:hypothetical protein